MIHSQQRPQPVPQAAGLYLQVTEAKGLRTLYPLIKQLLDVECPWGVDVTLSEAAAFSDKSVSEKGLSCEPSVSNTSNSCGNAHFRHKGGIWMSTTIHPLCHLHPFTSYFSPSGNSFSKMLIYLFFWGKDLSHGHN